MTRPRQHPAVESKADAVQDLDQAAGAPELTLVATSNAEADVADRHDDWQVHGSFEGRERSEKHTTHDLAMHDTTRSGPYVHAKWLQDHKGDEFHDR